MRNKLIILAISLTLGIVGLVKAAPAPKVFVCKYVGKPGVNETLQTGQNPISISQNAVKNFQGIGSSFNDAQGRSLVIAFDNGQPAPTCPTTQDNPGTPGTTPTNTPSNPSTPANETIDFNGFVGK